MNVLYRQLLLAAICAGSFGSAIAEDNNPVYINLNSGIAKLYNLPTGEWTGNLNAGYKFNPYFALEGGYNIFAGSEFGVTTATNILDVAAKGTLPLSEVFSLYGRAGLGYGMNSWSGTIVNSGNCLLCDNSIGSNYGLALVGLGGSFALTPHWDLRLEDTAYLPFSNTTTGTLMAVTFGTQYNF